MPRTNTPCYLSFSDATISISTCLLDIGSSLGRLAPLKAVLFDVDGTLCDSDPLHYYAFREMLQEIGYNNGVPIDEEFFVRNIAGRHSEDTAKILFPDWDHEKAMKFVDDKEPMFRRLVSKQLKAIEGLHKLCKWVKDRGLKHAAVTNAPRPNAELMISMLGLIDFFDAAVIGSKCQRAKLFPDPYLKALEKLNVSVEHTFIVEVGLVGKKKHHNGKLPFIVHLFSKSNQFNYFH
ncbi:haloacid dehalogenase-like hydrolase domain-containing protein Sgpp [Musa acuminata AAA Group]|uniref:haloacid dehalogenase-like hydrolase domain-containing protein Sgpp n=1 Tax=Musa acuminata AAA Group TaxID=214697 RepID=UPI0031E27F7F